jgi:cbb3-type cytochrome oxidase subunit 1
VVGCGVAFAWSSSDAVVDPTTDPVVAAVHLGVLATLSMGVLGAMHHFIPLLTHRPLRSVALARVGARPDPEWAGVCWQPRPW